jgi:hypothetical protein
MFSKRLRDCASNELLAATCVFFTVVTLAGCASKPVPSPTTLSVQQALPIASEPEAKAEPVPAKKEFDPTLVTQEQKKATFVDIRAFIESLNTIIKMQDYSAWLAHLTEDYIAYYSDPEMLAKFSEYPVIKRSGIKLKTLKDYFTYVVYPSRQNDQVDDIEFVGETLVKAITVNPKGDRNILYMLEKHGDAWKIGFGR